MDQNKVDTKEDHAFDEAAERIFASIPEGDRTLYAGQLVFIDPYADPAQGPLYVFGNTVHECIERADVRFGPMRRGELMSLATEDGRVPESVLQGLRGLY